MRLRYAPGAIRDMQRLREFLKQKNPLAAKRAGEAILRSVRRLGQHPQIGRPAEDMPPEFREWLIDFGNNGYVALYRFDSVEIVILALRHQKEAGYSSLK